MKKIGLTKKLYAPRTYLDKQKQAEGIKIAKEKGKRLGKPTIQYPENWKEVYPIWQKEEITAREAMKRLNLKPTIRKLVIPAHLHKSS